MSKMVVYRKFDDIPLGTYDVIYADPPWQYKTWTGKETKWGNAVSHYDTMPIADLSKFGINHIGKTNSHLICWATAPIIASGEFHKLMTAWEYEPKTILFCWVKTHTRNNAVTGRGHYTRPSTEFVFVCTKGSPKKVVNHAINQTVRSNVLGHSEKPAHIRRLVKALFGPKRRYIELFARTAAPDWGDTFGNDPRLDQGPLTKWRKR